MEQKRTIIPSYTKPFGKTNLTVRTFNNGMNQLKYGRIYIYIYIYVHNNQYTNVIQDHATCQRG